MDFMNMMVGLGAVGIFFGLILAAIGIFAFVFWILMLIDCIKRKFKNDTEKVIWILVLIFVHIIGALIYYFVVKKKNKK
jgi:hypothetical protein